MNYDTVVADLDKLLPDALVVETARKVLSETLDGNHYIFELDGKMRRFPSTADIVILTKALFKEYLPDGGFGDIKVMVSLGEVFREGGGISSTYCFVTLYFNKDVQLITSDFHSEWS